MLKTHMQAARLNFNVRCKCMRPEVASYDHMPEQHMQAATLNSSHLTLMYAACTCNVHPHALAALANSGAHRKPAIATHEHDMCMHLGFRFSSCSQCANSICKRGADWKPAYATHGLGMC
jgi:hypothetical protein